jgi:hypothetical protein
MQTQDRRRISGSALRLAWAIFLAAGSAGLTGCKPHGSADGTSGQAVDVSPEEVATLTQLTRELRRTMVRQRLSGSFEKFAAARSDLTIPPPPPGKKYAIDKKWKVVLVKL